MLQAGSDGAVFRQVVRLLQRKPGIFSSRKGQWLYRHLKNEPAGGRLREPLVKRPESGIILYLNRATSKKDAEHFPLKELKQRNPQHVPFHFDSRSGVLILK